MKTFEDIVRRCKASVHLDVNDHLSCYETLENHLMMYSHESYLDSHAAILSTGTIYSLTFYPHTPIGSYKVIGATMGEVVAKANAILDKIEK